MTCRTVGYFWEVGPVAVMLFDSMFDDWQNDDGTIGGMSTIPLGMIVGVRQI